MKIAIEYDGDMHDGTDVRKDLLGMLSSDLDERPVHRDEPFSVYVAAPSAEVERARAVAAALRARGVFVLGDEWMTAVRENGVGEEGRLPQSVLRGHAEDDLGSIEDATMVLVLTYEYQDGTSGGAMLEAGAALGLEKPLVTAGHPLHSLFRTKVLAEFTHGPNYADHDQEAVDFITAYAIGWSSAKGLPVAGFRVGRPAPYAAEPPEVDQDAPELPVATPPSPAKVVRPGDLVAQRLAAMTGGTDAEVEQARQAVKDAMEAADE